MIIVIHSHFDEWSQSSCAMEGGRWYSVERLREKLTVWNGAQLLSQLSRSGGLLGEEGREPGARGPLCDSEAKC